MDAQDQLVILALIALVVGTAVWLFIVPPLRRRRIDRMEFPRAWLDVLHRRLPCFSRMGSELQEELKQLAKRFLHEKRFVGCAGQPITDEVRVTIAAQACLLLLNRPNHEFSRLRTILVYPDNFLVERAEQDENGLVFHGSSVLAGESWDDGRVVLAWDSVDRGIRDFNDGYNVVLHEFAHQLDQESGTANGAPLLYSKGAYSEWAKVLSSEFLRLQEARDQGLQSEMDLYGATDPAEFFAVATETFYEKPWEMARYHPDLFDKLREYYRLDPRQWQKKNPAP